MIEKTFSEHLEEQDVLSKKMNDTHSENTSSSMDSLLLSLQEDITISSYGNRNVFRELPNETKLSIYQKMNLSNRKFKRR